MKEILEKCLKDGKYVCVYDDTEQPNNSSYGKLIGLDEDHYALSAISPEGRNDGIMIRPVDVVFRVNQGDPVYDAKMAVFMKRNGYREESMEVNDKDLIRWGLHLAEEKDWFVLISLRDTNNDDVVGLIQNMDEEICRVQEYDVFGNEAGMDSFLIDDITALWINGEDERKIEALIQAAETEAVRDPEQ